jgi:hypothetical protein
MSNVRSVPMSDKHLIGSGRGWGLTMKTMLFEVPAMANAARGGG